MPDDRRRDRTPTRLIRLPTKDEERLDAASADLLDSIETSRICTQEVARFTADVDSDKISTDGVVMDLFEEEDTLVKHVRTALRSIGV